MSLPELVSRAGDYSGAQATAKGWLLFFQRQQLSYQRLECSIFFSKGSQFFFFRHDGTLAGSFSFGKSPADLGSYHFFMSTNTQYIVQKLWNYCNILRDDGMSYADYVEQLTYLLFLKMAHERTQPPYNQPSRIPREYDWDSLLRTMGTNWRPTIATPWKNWASRAEWGIEDKTIDLRTGHLRSREEQERVESELDTLPTLLYILGADSEGSTSVL